MCINCDSFCLFEHTWQDNICCFPCNSWKGDKFLHSVRDLSVKSITYFFCCICKVFCLVSVKSCLIYIFFKLFYRGRGKILNSSVLFKKSFCNLIYLFIRALCRKYGCSKKFKRGSVFKRCFRRRIAFF